MTHAHPHTQLEDFDDGVVYQLAAKKSEEEALGALRTLAENDVSGIQHLAAYINHGEERERLLCMDDLMLFERVSGIQHLAAYANHGEDCVYLVVCLVWTRRAGLSPIVEVERKGIGHARWCCWKMTQAALNCSAACINHGKDGCCRVVNEQLPGCMLQSLDELCWLADVGHGFVWASVCTCTCLLTTITRVC